MMKVKYKTTERTYKNLLRSLIRLGVTVKCHRGKKIKHINEDNTMDKGLEEILD